MDKHKTAKLSNTLGVIVSAIFAAVGVAGFQRTDDVKQLMLFMVLAVLAFGVVKVLFMGINKLLDTLDDGRS